MYALQGLDERDDCVHKLSASAPEIVRGGDYPRSTYKLVVRLRSPFDHKDRM